MPRFTSFKFEQISRKLPDESVIPHEFKTLDNRTKPIFRWDKEDKIKKLVQSMLSYKSKIEFEANEFNSGKIKV